MKNNYFTKLILALIVGFFGLINASAQFLKNTTKVDVVQITTSMTLNNPLLEGVKPYAASVGVAANVAKPDYSSPAMLELSLDDVIVWGGDPVNTYDAATRTITFNKDWNGGAGWNVEGMDLSAYTHVTVEFENAQGGYVRLTTDYSVDPWGQEVGSNNPGVLTAALDLDRIDIIRRVTLGVNNADAAPRQVVLKRAYIWNESNPPVTLEYSLELLNFFANDGGEDVDAASYDPATKTVTYNDSWRRAGWNWEPDGGLDISGQGYSRVVLELDATMLPASGEGEGRAKLQFDIEYMDGSKEKAPDGGGWEGGNEYRAGDTQKVWWNLTQANTQKIKLITLKSEVAGNVVLKNAYFEMQGLPDLILTDIRWEPAKPKEGDQVEFFATIKNIGTGPSPAEKKHGVAFSVNGVVRSWSDGFFGPMAAGEEVEVSSRMQGSTGALWIAGANPTYTIRGEVNDTRDFPEADLTNNTLTVELSITTGIEKINVGSGTIYYAGGSLQAVNYPASAVLRVYNLAGVNVSGFLTVSEIKNISLTSGIYVIEVRSEGKTFTHKVIVK